MWFFLFVIFGQGSTLSSSIPPLDTLHSRWIPIRTCNPSADQVPCPGPTISRICYDYGCCWDDHNKTCYKPNDQSYPPAPMNLGERYAGNQQRPSLANMQSELQADSSGELFGVSCWTLPPYSQSCGDHPFASLVIDDTDSWKIAQEAQFQWKAWEIIRTAKVQTKTGIFNITSSVRLPFRKPMSLYRLVIDKYSEDSIEQVDDNLMNVQILVDPMMRNYSTSTWAWGFPHPDESNRGDFHYSYSSSNNVVSAMDSKSVSFGGITANVHAPVNPIWKFETSAEHGGYKIVFNVTSLPVTVDIVWAIGNDQNLVTELAIDNIRDFDKTWEYAQTGMESLWKGVFQPGNPYFPGNLPTLSTTNKAVETVYYWGVLSMLMNGHNGPLTQNRTLFPSGGPTSAVTALYVWDTFLNIQLWSYLDNEAFTWILSKYLEMDVHKYYAYDYISGNSVGVWYAFNDIMLFRAFDQLLRYSSDGKKFLSQVLDPKSQNKNIDWMYYYSTWWKNRVQGNEVLADYGLANNLLECVPTYIHRVPSLQGCNSFMMDIMSEIYSSTSLGVQNTTRAAQLKKEAKVVADTLIDRLYVKNKGYWSCEMPDGKLVSVRHIIDFTYLSISIPQYLNQTIRNEMLTFLEQQLLTPHWLRALSLSDPAAPASDRKDHGPWGAYDGWIGETIQSLIMLNETSKAIQFIENIAATYQNGPGGQSHQVLGKSNSTMTGLPAKADKDQQYFAMSGSVPANRIISGLFGVEPPISPDVTDPKAFLRDPDVKRPFSGTLQHVPIRGKLYTVTNDPNTGLHIMEE